MGIVLLPMAMTGYQDKRYLVPEMLALLLSTSVVMERSHNRAGIWLMSIALAATAPSFFKGVLQKPLQHRESVAERMATIESQIKALERQHMTMPSCRLIFKQEDHLLGAQYGATTGLPTALQPNNQASLLSRDLEALKQRLGKHWVVSAPASQTSEQLTCR